jgi:hypothetical protein
MRRTLAVLAGGLGATVLACQLVAGIERVDKVDPPPPEAGPDVVAVDAEVTDPCPHVRPPPPPTVDDAPAVSLEPIYLALREVTLSPSSPVGTVGYDLDRTCTCDSRPGAAFEGGASCVSGRAAQCDSDGGVDNQGGLALATYGTFVDIDKAANINGRIAEGKQTSIVVLTRYNGRANDSEVGFGLFTSEGMKDGPGCPGSVTDADGFTSPGWCGEDLWTASDTTVTGSDGNFVPRSAGTGYVTNYEFVVELNSPASIPFGGYKLTLGSPVSTGHLVPLDANLKPLDTSTPPAPELVKYWSVERAILGGRVPASELLAAAGTLFTPGDAGGTRPPLCASPLFGALKSQICDQIDISASKAFDFIPNARCDSLSVGVALRAASVRVNRIVPTALSTNICYPTADGGGPMAGPSGVDYQCP